MRTAGAFAVPTPCSALRNRPGQRRIRPRGLSRGPVQDFDPIRDGLARLDEADGCRLCEHELPDRDWSDGREIQPEVRRAQRSAPHSQHGSAIPDRCLRYVPSPLVVPPRTSRTASESLQDRTESTAAVSPVGARMLRPRGSHSIEEDPATVCVPVEEAHCAAYGTPGVRDEPTVLRRERRTDARRMRSCCPQPVGRVGTAPVCRGGSSRAP